MNADHVVNTCGHCGEYWPCSVVSSVGAYRGEEVAKHHVRATDAMEVLEPQRTAYTYTWQAWDGMTRLWEESGLSALEVLQRGRIESKRVPTILFRAMADGRDYVEIWRDGKPLRAGTFAMTTLVYGVAS